MSTIHGAAARPRRRRFKKLQPDWESLVQYTMSPRAVDQHGRPKENVPLRSIDFSLFGTYRNSHATDVWNFVIENASWPWDAPEFARIDVEEEEDDSRRSNNGGGWSGDSLGDRDPSHLIPNIDIAHHEEQQRSPLSNGDHPSDNNESETYSTQAPRSPRVKRINGRTYSETLEFYRETMVALSEPDARRERSRMRVDVKDLHFQFFPEDIGKKIVFFEEPKAPRIKPSAKRARETDAYQSITESGSAPKKKKLSTYTTPHPTPKQRKSLAGSPRPSMLSSKQDSSNATASLKPRFPASGNNMSTPPKGYFSVKGQNYLASGYTQARPAQPYISPYSLPPSSPAGKAPVHVGARVPASTAAFKGSSAPYSPSPPSSVVSDDDLETDFEGQDDDDEDEDEDEDEYEEKARKKHSSTKCPSLNRSPSSEGVSTSSREASGSSGATFTSTKKNGSWNTAEFDALERLLRARRALEAANGNLVVLKDEKLMAHMSMQLAQEGINRSKNACKNFWNRYGREMSQFEERVGGVTNRSLTTSAQSKKKS